MFYFSAAGTKPTVFFLLFSVIRETSLFRTPKAHLLMSLYISWQMKINACADAPCSRGAFCKLITCNSILVHLGATAGP